MRWGQLERREFTGLPIFPRKLDDGAQLGRDPKPAANVGSRVTTAWQQARNACLWNASDDRLIRYTQLGDTDTAIFPRQQDERRTPELRHAGASGIHG